MNARPRPRTSAVSPGASTDEVGVGGLLRRQVAQARRGGAGGEVELVRGGGGVEVPGGEHDGVGAQRRPALQVHDLRDAVRVDVLGEPGGAGAVQVHPHARGQPAEHVLQHPAQVGALQAAAGERGGGDGGQLVGQLGTDLGRRSAPTPRTTGPGAIGPSHTTDSSVYMVTSAAIEFIASSGDCACRQMRPAPGGYGSTRCTSRPSGCSSGALAARRSSRPVPRGPAPTITIVDTADSSRGRTVVNVREKPGPTRCGTGPRATVARAEPPCDRG